MDRTIVSLLVRAAFWLGVGVSSKVRVGNDVKSLCGLCPRFLQEWYHSTVISCGRRQNSVLMMEWVILAAAATLTAHIRAVQSLSLGLRTVRRFPLAPDSTLATGILYR